MFNSGANKGFWRYQLRDSKTKRFIPMGGAVTFEYHMPGTTTPVISHGVFVGRDKPGFAKIQVKDPGNSLPIGVYDVDDSKITAAKAIIPISGLPDGVEPNGESSNTGVDPKNVKNIIDRVKKEPSAGTAKDLVEGDVIQRSDTEDLGRVTNVDHSEDGKTSFDVMWSDGTSNFMEIPSDQKLKVWKDQTTSPEAIQKPKSRFTPPTDPAEIEALRIQAEEQKARIEEYRKEREAVKKLREEEAKQPPSKERRTGLFNEYSKERLQQTAEDVPLTDMGFDPEEEITIYRGVPKGIKGINPGDWVTDNPQLARDYAGPGDVVSMKVKAKDLLGDPSAGEGAYTTEMIYRPSTRDKNIEDLGIDFQTATMDADGARLPTPGAFTGEFQNIMEGAKDWNEVAERLKGQTVTYFDFETTGISDYDGDGIMNDPIQLGAVQVRDGKIVKRFNLYMNPGSKLSKWSAENLKRDVVDENGKITGTTLVTPDWLETQISQKEALQQFVDFIGPNALLGGQNVPFDLELLKRMAEANGIKLDVAGTIDSKDLASLLPKYDPEKGIDGPKAPDRKTGEIKATSSLGPVANFLGFEPANWHSADGDAEDSYNLVSKIIERAGKEGNKDLSLLDFPAQAEKYREKMDAFKAAVSGDNPITEKQSDALKNFAESDNPVIANLAKAALPLTKTRGKAAEVLAKINELQELSVSNKDTIKKPKTLESLPIANFYNSYRYKPISDIELNINSDDGELDSFEVDAIDNYMGAMYTEINPAVRMYPDLSGKDMLDSVDPSTITAVSPWNGEEYHLDSTKAFEYIELLDSAFSKSKLKNDEIVFRGLHVSPNDYDSLLSLEVGDELVDTGYMSTSTNLERVTEYANRTNGSGGNLNPVDGNKPVIYRINAVKNTPAFYSEELERGEDELIIGRNTKMVVTGISKTSGGILIVDVKTIPKVSK